MEQRVQTSDGCGLSTYLDGRTDAPWVVLSSSLGTSAGMWARQCEALAKTHCVLRYDPRGHGRSDAPAGDYTIARLATDVLEILDRYALERVHFCGVSLGGMVGQWLGAHAAERIDRLVLANTAAFMGPASGWDERIARVRSEGMGSIADAVIERWFTPGFHDASLAETRAQLLATSPIGYTGCCAAIRDLDLRESARAITSPTLIIAGSRDPATPPSCASELALAMPAQPRVVMLEAAHLSNLEQPTAFNRALCEFLS